MNDVIDRIAEKYFPDPRFSSHRELCVMAIKEANAELVKQNVALRSALESALLLENANHQSGCSIQDSQEPHCDCGYEQGRQAALHEMQLALSTTP